QWADASWQFDWRRQQPDAVLGRRHRCETKEEDPEKAFHRLRLPDRAGVSSPGCLGYSVNWVMLNSSSLSWMLISIRTNFVPGLASIRMIRSQACGRRSLNFAAGFITRKSFGA